MRYWRLQAFRIAVYLDDGLGECLSFADCCSQSLAVKSNMLGFGNVCKLMTKSLHRALDRREGWKSRVDLDHAARKELEFWKSNVSHLNSRCFADAIRRPSRIVYSDASAVGCPAFIAIDMPVSHKNWDSLQIKQSSTWRKLHCVSFALKRFAHRLSGCFVKCLLTAKPFL